MLVNRCLIFPRRVPLPTAGGLGNTPLDKRNRGRRDWLCPASTAKAGRRPQQTTMPLSTAAPCSPAVAPGALGGVERRQKELPQAQFLRGT